MHRINFFVNDKLFKSLKELPGTLSEHLRRAAEEYLVRFKGFDVSASQSKRKEDE